MKSTGVRVSLGKFEINRSAVARGAWSALAWGALSCTGIELIEPNLPREPATPFDPTSLIGPTSLLTTELTANLAALLSEADAAVAAVADEAIAQSQRAATAGAPRAKDKAGETQRGKLDEGARGPSPRASTLAKEESGDEHAAWRELDEQVRFTWRVARGEVHSRFDKGVLQVEVPFTYGVAVAVEGPRGPVRVHGCGCEREEWCGGSGGARKTGLVRWSVPLTWAAGARLMGTPEVKVDAPGECRLPQAVGRPHFDGKERLLASLESLPAQGTERLRAVVSEFPGVEKAVRPLWTSLHEPVALDEKQGPWLKLRPRGLEMGELRIVEERATFPVRVAVQPVLSPWAPDPATKAEWPPPEGVGDARGFRIVGRQPVDLAELRAPIEQTFLQRRYPKRKGYQVEPHFVEVTDVQLYKSAGKVVVAFVLDGTAHGRIAYTGTLHVDPDSEVLEIVELELTEESRESLGLLYDKVELPDLRIEQRPWIDEEEVRAELARTVRWPLNQKLAALRRKVQLAARSAASPSHQLRFVVEEYEFLGVSMSEDAVDVVVVMTGAAQLSPHQAAPVAEKASQGDAGNQ